MLKLIWILVMSGKRQRGGGEKEKLLAPHRERALATYNACLCAYIDACSSQCAVGSPAPAGHRVGLELDLGSLLFYFF